MISGRLFAIARNFACSGVLFSLRRSFTQGLFVMLIQRASVQNARVALPFSSKRTAQLDINASIQNDLDRTAKLFPDRRHTHSLFRDMAPTRAFLGHLQKRSSQGPKRIIVDAASTSQLAGLAALIDKDVAPASSNGSKFRLTASNLQSDWGQQPVVVDTTALLEADRHKLGYWVYAHLRQGTDLQKIAFGPQLLGDTGLFQPSKRLKQVMGECRTENVVAAWERRAREKSLQNPRGVLSQHWWWDNDSKKLNIDPAHYTRTMFQALPPKSLVLLGKTELIADGEKHMRDAGFKLIPIPENPKPPSTLRTTGDVLDYIDQKSIEPDNKAATESGYSPISNPPAYLWERPE